MRQFEPLNAFCFTLEIPELKIFRKQAFFKSISGLKSESEVIPYKEGGLNTTTHKLIGPTQWPNLVLKRGFVGWSKDANRGKPPFGLIKWRESFLDDESKKYPDRVNGKVIQLSSDMIEVCAWKFIAGWPCKWEGPDFDASKSELAIQTLEIAHEGLIFEDEVG